MKKVLLILLSVCCMLGVAYLGYIIFSATSVESFEILGEIQTLYVANECIEPDFQDAEIKVKYKNGTIKVYKLTNKRVDVTSFSTAEAGHKTMRIFYKGCEIQVEYDVVNSGLFYNSSSFIEESSALPTTYTMNNSPIMFFIRKNGELEYYYRNSSNVYMHDGYYDKSYRFEIVSNTMNVYLGTEEPTLKLISNYNEEGTFSLKYVNRTEGVGTYSTSVRIYKFHENFKTNRVVSSVTPVVDGSTDPNAIAVFSRYQTIKSNGTILLKVQYANDYYLKTIYVHMVDEMLFNKESFNTQDIKGSSYMSASYGSTERDVKHFNIYYKVV